MRNWLLVSLALFGLTLGLVGLTGAGTARAANGSGTVTIVHGVPGLTVDVYVNGQRTLSNFQPDTITDPLTLPAGTYQIAIRPAGADPMSAPAISGSAALAAGANVSLVAHLSESGAPMLSAFVNDTAPIAAGKSRLVVRHTAAAPAVDVLANGSALFKGLTNPNQAAADVPAGTYSAAVAPAGSTTPVLGPADLTLAPGKAQIVYAVGSLEQKTLKLLVQTLSVAAQQQNADPAAPATQKDGCVFFPQTNHNACAGFAAYWAHYGGLPVYGYPLTEEFTENGVTIQYFERARFEWHPGSDAQRFDVQLGRIGAELLAIRPPGPR